MVTAIGLRERCQNVVTLEVASVLTFVMTRSHMSEELNCSGQRKYRAMCFLGASSGSLSPCARAVVVCVDTRRM